MIKKFEAFKYISSKWKGNLKLEFDNKDLDNFVRFGFDKINPYLLKCKEGKYDIDLIKTEHYDEEHENTYIYYTFNIMENGKKIRAFDISRLENEELHHNSIKYVLEEIFDFFKEELNIDLEYEQEYMTEYTKREKEERLRIKSEAERIKREEEEEKIKHKEVDPYGEEEWKEKSKPIIKKKDDDIFDLFQ